MAPRNISDSNENFRCYNCQAFANIRGNFTTLLMTSHKSCQNKGQNIS